jgi:hypothetical protein
MCGEKSHASESSALCKRHSPYGVFKMVFGSPARKLEKRSAGESTFPGLPPKRQRTAALHDAGASQYVPATPPGLGLRESSRAFRDDSRLLAPNREGTPQEWPVDRKPPTTSPIFFVFWRREEGRPDNQIDGRAAKKQKWVCWRVPIYLPTGHPYGGMALT